MHFYIKFCSFFFSNSNYYIIIIKHIILENRNIYNTYIYAILSKSECAREHTF